MDLNEIKKQILKQKPEARLTYIRKGSAFYYADLTEKRVYFKIPVSDMGDADFGSVMEAKLLNRWIYLTD